MKEYFDILGIDINSTEEDIRKARRKLCSKYHPDQGGDAVMFNKVNEAYNIVMKYKKNGVIPTGGSHRQSKKSCVRHKDLFNVY